VSKQTKKNWSGASRNTTHTCVSLSKSCPTISLSGHRGLSPKEEEEEEKKESDFSTGEKEVFDSEGISFALCIISLTFQDF